ncbi:hypothetical protein BCT35_19160 [Vibrio lentus]|uniref:YadA C-terminal domain-containing protein n=1 Tax=Vibrio lentus TaxID=136468 RepID=UPI000C855E88|nr:YadA C-terminal domain-containing protein [Vibrio lentus]PMI39245.1 hypothetical protein BCU45_03070 [Vibrio lentus]PMI63878.1 hypothetical protein BCU40_02650 [Vibrio lentus]PMJ50666.1 hypothetical protein BCU20_08650 [Vibrio lentus]PML47526.1 hypothetical protein BCT75_03490 [Vibrio lentus]PMN06913.1 hypothetical protein BCT42_00240 [Vibrio lentus]
MKRTILATLIAATSFGSIAAETNILDPRDKTGYELLETLSDLGNGNASELREIMENGTIGEKNAFFDEVKGDILEMDKKEQAAALMVMNNISVSTKYDSLLDQLVNGGNYSNFSPEFKAAYNDFKESDYYGGDRSNADVKKFLESKQRDNTPVEPRTLGGQTTIEQKVAVLDHMISDTYTVTNSGGVVSVTDSQGNQLTQDQILDVVNDSRNNVGINPPVEDLEPIKPIHRGKPGAGVPELGDGWVKVPENGSPIVKLPTQPVEDLEPRNPVVDERIVEAVTEYVKNNNGEVGIPPINDGDLNPIQPPVEDMPIVEPIQPGEMGQGQVIAHSQAAQAQTQSQIDELYALGNQNASDIDTLFSEVDRLDTRIDQTQALNAATVNARPMVTHGMTAFGAGVGYAGSEAALAIGVAHAFVDTGWSASGTLAASSDDVVVGAGAQYAF